MPADDVQPPVRQSLQDLLDLARAADLLELIVGEPHDAELALRGAWLGVQDVLDHLAVAVLEDVQRHALRRQRDDSERKERKR